MYYLHLGTQGPLLYAHSVFYAHKKSFLHNMLFKHADKSL